MCVFEVSQTDPELQVITSDLVLGVSWRSGNQAPKRGVTQFYLSTDGKCKIEQEDRIFADFLCDNHKVFVS